MYNCTIYSFVNINFLKNFLFVGLVKLDFIRGFLKWNFAPPKKKPNKVH